MRWRTKVGNAVFWALCLTALALVITPAVWLAAGIIARALPHLSFSIFTERTNGITGGL